MTLDTCLAPKIQPDFVISIIYLMSTNIFILLECILIASFVLTQLMLIFSFLTSLKTEFLSFITFYFSRLHKTN